MEIFDKLFFYSISFYNSPKPDYQRAILQQIDFSQKMIALIGAKGVGKTTLLHQYMADLNLSLKQVLYISLDHPIINGHKLLDIAEVFYQRGGKILLVDEIHYQADFERDLKTIYDFFDLKVVFSGSSAIALDKADLSRRAVIYRVPVLSFREFLELKTQQSFQSYVITDIVDQHFEIAAGILSDIKPLQYFADYLRYGAYPFFIEGEAVFILKLNEAVNKVIETDLPLIHHIDTKNITILKKLLVRLCESPPGEVNMSSLSRDAGINIRTLYHYIYALDSGELIRIIGAKTKASLNKPDKILLNNPNLFQALCLSSNKGTLRESFFTSMLAKHHINYVKSGDYLIDDSYFFEIGGKNKDFSQIKNIPNSYLAIDDIELGGERKIPLWLLGFLY
ncbi:ATP-binding protein [Candidatus Marithrix sp. Canyon 246]|uniref:ATP-binding protein n=1 Tax=Candidatus Marithrix sp. Canyon 246 TaxID=1827136 RepID=UPI000849FB94|nr:AAA family ATPase [Candidatus Marithrix sp. Canyon 246]